jgi:hypothetical protein
LPSTKLTSNLELEELLKELDKAPEVEDRINLSDSITAFLRKYKLVPGEHPVSTLVLYDLYKITEPEPKSKTAFSRFVKKLFNGGKGRIIYVNQDMYKLLEVIELKKKNKRKVIVPGRMKNARRQLEGFFRYYGICSGNRSIEAYVLYHLYDKWVFRKRNQNMSEKVFTGICKLYLKDTHVRGVNGFKVSEEVFKHLPNDYLMELRNGRKWRNEKIKKTKQKKSG